MIFIYFNPTNTILLILTLFFKKEFFFSFTHSEVLRSSFFIGFTEFKLFLCAQLKQRTPLF